MNNELKEVYLKLASKVGDMEDQLIRHIPVLIENATDEKLSEALTAHLGETQEQRARMGKILVDYSEFAEGDKVFENMLAESTAEMMQITDASVRDAYIIASASTVENIEIAKYTTLIEWAKQLELSDDEDLLGKNLEEEEEAEKKLASIATGGLFSSGVVEMAASSN